VLPMQAGHVGEGLDPWMQTCYHSGTSIRLMIDAQKIG
jgi:hypothetical protein